MVIMVALSLYYLLQIDMFTVFTSSLECVNGYRADNGCI